MSCLVGVEGIEPLAATPLDNGHRVTAGDGEQHPFNTLFRMCVLKSTVCDISVHVSSMLFNTLPFSLPQKEVPSGRPPVCSMFYVRSVDLVSTYSHVCDTSQARELYFLAHLMLYGNREHE